MKIVRELTMEAVKAREHHLTIAIKGQVLWEMARELFRELPSRYLGAYFDKRILYS